jgi:hypothetical protein
MLKGRVAIVQALIWAACAAVVVFLADIQRRVNQERGGRVVAEEQVEAEGKIADQTIEKVRERDVYREHITKVVREGQESVNAVNKGQQLDPTIDAAVAGGLCGVHDSLCRRSGAAPVQPIRQPVSGSNGAR